MGDTELDLMVFAEALPLCVGASMNIKERLLGVAGYSKRPTLVIYWADTQELLSHFERTLISGDETEVVDITPLEVLLLDTKSNRKIVVRGITDEHLPAYLMSES